MLSAASGSTAMGPGTTATPQAATGSDNDGTRQQPPPPPSDRDEQGTRHHCGATRAIAMDLVSIASSIQEDPTAWTVMMRPWADVQERSRFCGLRCVMQRRLHGELHTVRVHVTVFGEYARAGCLVEDKLASKQCRLQDACGDVFRVLLRKYSVPHFATVLVIPLERRDGNGVH